MGAGQRLLRVWSAGVAAPAAGVWRTALDAALPRLCAACRAPVAGEGVCPECWSRLSFIGRPYCERLGIPFAHDPGPGVLSAQAVERRPACHRARAAVRYDDTARTLVQALKYGDRLDLAPMMGRWMTRAGRELLAEADALVPVPLHWRRALMRRFNQSAHLAKAISRETGVTVLDAALRRIRATPQQVGLSKAERLGNVQGAFAVPDHTAHRIAGLRLVLVDDVATSGATADACARTLLRAGAASVDLVTFARVVVPGRDGHID